MRRSLITVAAVAVTLPLGILIGQFDLQGASARDEIIVMEHASSDTVIDNGDPGDTAGDTLVFANDIYDADDVNLIGSDQGSCVRVKAASKKDAVDGLWECNWTVSLADGNLSVQGKSVDDGTATTLTVTGGTGAYASASGEMLLEPINDGAEYRFTFRIDD
ncbi:MAG: allene oxide cyclase family protein [Thermomicrobiales bacterium]